MIIVPSVQIYWNESKNQFVLQELASVPDGGSGEFGPPIILTAEDFDSQVGRLVLDCLRNYRKNVYNEDLVRRHSDKERRKFVKDHLLVNVAQISAAQIQVSPCERHGLSYSGVKGAAVILKLDSAEKELPNVLREAFHRAC